MKEKKVMDDANQKRKNDIDMILDNFSSIAQWDASGEKKLPGIC